MCGIAGIVSLGAPPPGPSEILAMCAAIRHRGPDNTGYGLYGPTALGSTRLKIIDLSTAANQPASNERRNIHVVLNGEIYNYRDLRERLLAAGHQFSSHSDTEVLVHLYEDMGPSFVEKLDGMFAIALWDDVKQQLVLARDRAGKRPLFYYHDDNLFAFGSEIKALLAHQLVPSEMAAEFLSVYLSFGYVPCPFTFYRGIHQIDPGHVAVLSAGRFHSEPFWTLRMAPRGRIPIEQACEEIRSLVHKAVKKRLISDVPLGVLLSGGLDSSIVVAAASEELNGLKTFSAVFPDEPAFNEARYARVVAERFGTDHHELEVRPHASELFETLVYHHDQPFMDSSAVPTFLISRLAREHVTVALNGDGGDELFAGYARFWAVGRLQRSPSWVFRLAGSVAPALERSNKARLRQRLLRWTDTARFPAADRYAVYASLFLRFLDTLLRPEVRQAAVDPLFSFRAHEQDVAGLPPLARMLSLN
jgi:asparagine synthase (glutamine-hydrolysing)